MHYYIVFWLRKETYISPAKRKEKSRRKSPCPVN
jgi:hypothetical protein